MPRPTILNTAILVQRTLMARGSLAQKLAAIRDYKTYRKAISVDACPFPVERTRSMNWLGI